MVALLLLSNLAYAGSNGVCLVRIEPNGGGSGFFVDDNKIITAYHVIDGCIDNQRRVRIEFDGKTAIAKVIRFNVDTDVALLEAEVEGETILKLADNPPKIGDKVINRGHPKSKWDVHKGEGTLKEIATLIRTYTDGTKSKTKQYITQSHVIEGMSGGPVFNENEEVIGLISARTLDFTQAYCPTLEQLKEILEEDTLELTSPENSK